MTELAPPADTTPEPPGAESDFHRYARLLGPLFDAEQHMRSDRLFEYVCCLVRAGGIEAQDSDPIFETSALLDDLEKLSQVDLQQFERPERTRARLALIAYCHVVEADFFYRVLATLAPIPARRARDRANARKMAPLPRGGTSRARTRSAFGGV